MIRGRMHISPDCRLVPQDLDGLPCLSWSCGGKCRRPPFLCTSCELWDWARGGSSETTQTRQWRARVNGRRLAATEIRVRTRHSLRGFWRTTRSRPPQDHDGDNLVSVAASPGLKASRTERNRIYSLGSSRDTTGYVIYTANPFLRPSPSTIPKYPAYLDQFLVTPKRLPPVAHLGHHNLTYQDSECILGI